MICRVCRLDKPEDWFHRRTKSPTGRMSHCRQCDKDYRRSPDGKANTLRAQAKRRTKAAREARNAYRQRTRPLYRAVERRHSIAYRARYPEKVKARRLLRKAILSGLVIKPANCEKCGVTPRRLHGHHHLGHDSPLAVMWLCVRCHSEEHNRALLPPSEPTKEKSE